MDLCIFLTTQRTVWIKKTDSNVKIFLKITIFSVSPCNPSEHLPLLAVGSSMKEAPKGTKISQFWHFTFPVDSQPCNQFSFSGYESHFIFFPLFISLFAQWGQNSSSPMDNYQIKSPAYEMLQSETSRTIVEPGGATTSSRQQHLWIKRKNHHCFKGTNPTFSNPVLLGRLIHNI